MAPAPPSRSPADREHDVHHPVKRRPIVTVKQALVPAGDGGRFDLKVGTTTVKAAAGNGEFGTTDIAYGAATTVQITAAAGTTLASYDAQLDCGAAGTSDGPSIALTT